jgi:hypothetical protein
MTAQASDAASPSGRTATVNLPFVGTSLRVPRVRAPHLSAPHLPTPRLPSLPPVGRREVGYAARSAASYLPPRRELVYYTGLGVLTALEVLEWPVAVAVAAGTAVARRSARDEHRAEPVRHREEPVAPEEQKSSADEGGRKSRAARLTRRFTGK